MSVVNAIKVGSEAFKIKWVKDPNTQRWYMEGARYEFSWGTGMNVCIKHSKGKPNPEYVSLEEGAQLGVEVSPEDWEGFINFYKEELAKRPQGVGSGVFKIKSSMAVAPAPAPKEPKGKPAPRSLESSSEEFLLQNKKLETEAEEAKKKLAEQEALARKGQEEIEELKKQLAEAKAVKSSAPKASNEPPKPLSADEKKAVKKASKDAADLVAKSQESK